MKKLLILLSSLLLLCGCTPALPLSDTAPFYTVSLSFDTETTATLTQTVTCLVPAEEELLLHLYANTARTDGGGIRIEALSVNGEAAAYLLSEDRCLLRVLHSFAVGQRITVSLTAKLTVPACRARFGYCESFLSLADCFPLLAHYSPVTRWNTFTPNGIGLPYRSQASSYRVTLTVPDGYRLSTVGTVCSAEGNTYTVEAVGVRDYAVFLSRESREATCRVSGVRLRTVFTDGRGERALQAAREMLDWLTRNVGPYPYTELTLCQSGLRGPSASYGGLILIGGHETEEALALTCATEVARQYFGAVVGSDGITEPWVSHALSRFCVLLAKPADTARALAEQWESEVREAVRQAEERGQYLHTAVGGSIAQYQSEEEFRLAVENNGALMYDRICRLIGYDTFLRVLGAYYKENALQLVSGETLISAFVTYSSTDVSGLFLSSLNHMPD